MHMAVCHMHMAISYCTLDLNKVRVATFRVESVLKTESSDKLFRCHYFWTNGREDLWMFWLQIDNLDTQLVSSQVPQPLLLVDGWVYNTQKTWEFYFDPVQNFFFGHTS